MKIIKRTFLVIVTIAMVFTSTEVSALSILNAQTDDTAATSDTDVKIELIQNNTVVETGTNVLTHTRNYTRSSTKTNGDEIVITAPEGVHYLMVQLDKYCGIPNYTGMLEEERVEGSSKPANMSAVEYGETLVYLVNNEFHFVIPGLTGTDAGGTTLGGGNWPYDSRAFSTSGNTEKVITARVATEEEINQRRNLALNPFDLHGNDNGLTSPNQKGDINVFPHAYANRTTDNKREFEARNAIDGFEYNSSHVGFPYQAWGCGNEAADSEFSILFGRYVEIDQIDITVRAQWNPPQPNNANDHDINWPSATLEFSDGTEMPITLEKLASPQTIKLPEKKVVSWVRLKDLPVSEETIPVDGRKKFSALTEFKVWGTEIDNSSVDLPSAESLVDLAKKVNDYWIKTGGNTGNDATNYNHGHSVTSEFWAPSVFYTGNMEAYYLTGDENYTDYANRWGSNNIYNNTAWNTKADSGRTGKYFPDNHTSFQTYLDMYAITAEGGFDASDEKIQNVVPVMNEMEQMSISDLKNKNGYWDRIDFFYMELPNWTKMYLLTGEDKWLDKLRALYDDRKAELYDEETGLFYRDKNYVYDPNATYNPDSNGNNQKISPNGKKILWSRGNGWAIAALTKILQDLPDDRIDDRKEYETVFKKMAATLIQVQGEDGFWRMNLDDYDHDIRPETSGTVFFAYALAWGINNGLLDKGTYYPAVKKAFLGLNANAIRPDGLVGRSELISAYPNPSCSLGIGSSQSYAPAATVMFLSELSKLVEQGYVTDDVEPALNKKMIGSIAVKEDSKYAVVNSRVRELVGGTELTTIKQDNKIYVPKDFVQEVYGEDIANEITDAIVNGGVSYVALDGVILEGSNRKLSSIANGISIISYKTELFNPTIDSKLIDLLNTGLTDGKYLERPDYEIRFNYTTPVEVPKPAADALISTEASTSGAVSASRSIGPNTESLVNVEFDMITTLTPSQTNAIVGLGSSDSNYGAYSQVPIIIRMYKDGSIGAYNGTGYVQSGFKFTQNEKYHFRVSIDLETQKYSVFVTAPDQEETMIAENYAFRKTAQVPSEIGKIYLFNNDQAAGKYWLEDIYLGEHLAPSKEALISTVSDTNGAISASKQLGPSTGSLVNVEFDMITTLTPSQTNAIVGLGSSDSNYGAYSQVPIIIRMYKDGCFGVYNGTGYYQSSIKFTQKEMYHLRVSVDLKAQKYSVFVTVPDQEETMIADNLAFRKTAQVPSEIGKIYLFNNDQEAGKYWIDNISLESKVTDVNKGALQELIDEVEELDENNYTAASWQTLQEALIAAKEVNDNVDAIQGEIDEACTILQAAKDNLVEKGTIAADKLALSIAVDLASNVTEEQLDKVVPAVVNEFNAALAEAKTILADDNAAQETVNASFARLSLAMHMLEFEKGDKTALQELIETANKLVEMDYTAASWQGLNEALQNAIDVNDDVNAMQEEVDDAYEALQEAMNNLVEAEEVNKTYLTTLVNYILGLDSDKYVTQTWEAMVPVLEKAQEVLANEEATQTEVDNIYLELINAFLQLRLKTEATDKTTLEVLIKEAETYQEKDFTNTSWQTLQETLKIAREVMDNETANQQEVDEACTMLQEAINNLVVRADKTLLEAMVNKISGLQENKYTESSWQAMIPVLEKAQEVLVNEEASQLEVDSALEGLTKVYLDLRLKPNKDLLNDLIKQVNGSNKASYSAKTWNAVEKALVKAVIVLNDPEASQAEVDDASYALAKAMAKLQEVNIVKTEAAVSVATGDNAAVYELFACSALLSLMYILKKVKF